ncbi:hypothetical protein AA103196_1735 [Ameyamaea chiangmaiensis NBRC 103196]|nr:hypothetical protein AA103196_1735 [Ameyamaea chiangmaiensis NBRC 103196]
MHGRLAVHVRLQLRDNGKFSAIISTFTQHGLETTMGLGGTAEIKRHELGVYMPVRHCTGDGIIREVGVQCYMTATGEAGFRVRWAGSMRRSGKSPTLTKAANNRS